MTTGLLERNDRAAAIELLHEATAFYTAEPVVDQLLGMLNWPSGNSRLVDTSCGDGAFLGAALHKLLDTEPGAQDSRISDLINGFEIHYFAVAEAQRRLARILVEHGRTEACASRLAESMVTLGDFLTEGPTTPTWDCIAGNPPFLRYANLPTILRMEYERTLPDYSQGDMLHSFLDRITMTLRTGGEIGLVTSDRWLSTQCASELRHVVGQRMGLHHLERLDCASAFYRPKNRRAGQLPRVHPVVFVLRELAAGGKELTRDPIYPDAENAVHASCRPLSAIGHVRLAPWLGKHGLFVVDQATADAAGIDSAMLVPAIDADNIKGGVLRPATKFAIRTFRNTEPPPEIMRHLDSNMHLLAKSKVRTKQRWLPPESFERMDLGQPSLLIPRIASSLRPVRIPAGILPLDHGISIVPAGETSIEQLEEALMRPESLDWIRARAPRLENGYFSLTTTLLRELPISF